MPATVLTFKAPTNSAPTMASDATNPTDGNRWLISDTSKDHIFIFTNGHASPITIACAGVAKTVTFPPYGNVSMTAATISAAVANGAVGVFKLTADQLQAYMDSSSYVTFTYTSGNAALVVAALSI
jgi:hypothetical protein